MRRALILVAAIGCEREPVERDASTRALPAPSAVSAPSAAPAPAPSPAPEPARPSPAEARRVLHFGDSTVPLVGNYLRPVYESRGATYRMLSTRSSTFRSFSTDASLPAALDESDPDLVLISLGSNDLFERELGAVAESVRAIVAKLGGRRCFWIGPPAWAKGYGALETLRDNVAPCDYFDSTRLQFSRQADGRHPDWSSSYGWASAVWRTLGGQGPVPKH